MNAMNRNVFQMTKEESENVGICLTISLLQLAVLENQPLSLKTLLDLIIMYLLSIFIFH